MRGLTALCAAAVGLSASALAQSPPSGAYPLAVTASEPLSYWRLGEQAGAEFRDSAGAHHGTINGNVSLGQPGALANDPDTAMALDGATQSFLEGTDEAPFRFGAGDPITLEAWVRPTQARTLSAIIAKGTDGGTRNWFLALTGTGPGVAELRFLYTSQGALHLYRVHSAPIPIGAYSHVAFSYTFGQGPSATAYVDGEAKAGFWASGDGNASPDASAARVRLGGEQNSQESEMYAGRLDEVALYRRIVPAEQVAAHHAAADPANAVDPDELDDPPEDPVRVKTRVDGATNGDTAGYSVASAGDVNEDGSDDLLIGVPGADFNGADSGSVYVIFGRDPQAPTDFADLRRGTIDLAMLTALDGFRIDGAHEGDRAGASVAGAGDVDLDGLNDFAIGAPGADNTGTDSGSVYVVYGDRLNLGFELDDLFNRGYRIDGAAAGDQAGASVAGMAGIRATQRHTGDISGDGLDDIAVGAPGEDAEGRTNSGAAYMVYGRANFFGTIRLGSNSTLDYHRSWGANAGDRAGVSVARLGNFGGSGRPDIAVGTDAEARVYVVYGKVGNPVDLANPDNSEAQIIRVEHQGGADGVKPVASPGDLNGDGLDDLLVGSQDGSAYLVYGSAAAAVNTTIPGPWGARFHMGPQPGAEDQPRFGAAVAGAGDLNADAIPDLLIGAPGRDQGLGAAYAIFGKRGPMDGFDPESLHTSSHEGLAISSAGEATGSSVSALGDFDHDGTADVAVGAPVAENNLLRTDSGSVLVVADALPEPVTEGTSLAPRNTDPPIIRGSARQGEILRADRGSWDGFRPMDFAFQWLRCDGAGNNCQAIAGATKEEYGLRSADVGATIRVQVTASNAVGSAAVTSELTGPVGAQTVFDTLPPRITLSGTLADVNGQIVQGTSFDLGVDVSDLVIPDVVASGVKEIKVKVNGVVAHTKDQPCDETCPEELSTDFAFQANQDSDYDIEVIATDLRGNLATEPLFVSVVHATQLPAQTLSLDTEPGFRIEGGSPGDEAGHAVANVGDANADGFDDYLIGAPGADNDRGAAYLVYGANSTTPVTLSGTSPRFVKFSGESTGDRAGSAVAPGGDVNGDGLLDFVVGAPGVGAPVQLQGTVYVVFGSANQTSLDLGNLGQNGFKVAGPLAATNLDLGPPAPVAFGAQLASRKLGDFAVNGDVNADGRDDVVIGASGEGHLTRPQGGVAFVIFGKADTQTIDLAATNGDPGERGFRIFGALPLDQAGQSTAIIGNLNADENADLLVITPKANQLARPGGGEAYVVFGKEGSDDVDLAGLGTGGYPILGADGDGLISAAGPGDVNGDRADDLLVGGKGAWILYGKSGVEPVDLAGEFSGYEMSAPPGEGFSGAQVSGAGDIDGDDSPDALVGFPSANGGSGVGFLVFGQTDPASVDLGSLPANKGTRFDGAGGSAATRSSGGADVAEGEQPTVLVGSPNKGGGAGEVRASSSARFSAAKPDNRCYNGREDPWPPAQPNTFFYIDRFKSVPRCRRARNGITDITSFGSRRPHTRKLRCGTTSPNCGRSPWNGGNARKFVDEPSGEGPVALVDSFGKPHAYIGRVRPNCFEILNATKGREGFTDSDNTCSNGVATPVEIEVQGKACMKIPALEQEHWMVRVMNVEGSSGARFAGLQGFIARGAIEFPADVRDEYRDDLNNAYATCGRRPPRRGTTGAPYPLRVGDNFSTDPADRYIPPRKARALCLQSSCGGPYANYQGATFQPELAAL